MITILNRPCGLAAGILCCLLFAGVAFAQIQVTAQVKPVNCDPTLKGAIILEVKGGVAPYQFQWSNGSQEKDLLEVAEGTYKVRVIDAKGVVANTQFSVNTYSSMKIKLSAKNTTVGNTNDGSLTAEVVGGRKPYQYKWISFAEKNKQFPSLESIQNLPSGNYLLIVQDANGCSTLAQAKVNHATTTKK